jgi:hypothetical protein
MNYPSQIFAIWSVNPGNSGVQQLQHFSDLGYGTESRLL